ncbi:MAG: hypothetical protein Q7S53_03680 [bacterium]|nr:hypothetical protein [bacterium]
MKQKWEEEEERLRKNRKSKKKPVQKMKVSGKSVFGIAKELKKK